MESSSYVYRIEVEWKKDNELFRDEFYGYAVNPGQATKNLLDEIQEGLVRPCHPVPDRDTVRVVEIVELGSVSFKS